jgi:hypothetical protein
MKLVEQWLLNGLTIVFLEHRKFCGICSSFIKLLALISLPFCIVMWSHWCWNFDDIMNWIYNWFSLSLSLPFREEGKSLPCWHVWCKSLHHPPALSLRTSKTWGFPYWGCGLVTCIQRLHICAHTTLPSSPSPCNRSSQPTLPSWLCLTMDSSTLTAMVNWQTVCW